MEPVLKVLFTYVVAKRSEKCGHRIVFAVFDCFRQIIVISLVRIWLRRGQLDGRSWNVVVTLGLRHAPLPLHQRAAPPQTSTVSLAKARGLRRHSIARRHWGRAVLTDWLVVTGLFTDDCRIRPQVLTHSTGGDVNRA